METETLGSSQEQQAERIKKPPYLIKSPKEIRGGTDVVEFERFLNSCQVAYCDGYGEYELDLSDVFFMDTTGFRLIFDYLPIFNKVIPPKDPHIIDMYNVWLDSKKGLSKGQL